MLHVRQVFENADIYKMTHMSKAGSIMLSFVHISCRYLDETIRSKAAEDWDLTATATVLAHLFELGHCLSVKPVPPHLRIHE